MKSHPPEPRLRRTFQTWCGVLAAIAALAQEAAPSKPQAASGPSPKTGSPQTPCPATGKGGAVNFANRAVSSGIDARVFGVGGKDPLSGPGYVAQLYGAPCDREAAFVPLDTPTPFRTGIAAGYITSRTVTLPNVAPRQPAFVQMRCWEAAHPSFERAVEKGAPIAKSVVVRVIAGGSIPGVMGMVPPDLAGLKSFSLSPGKTP